MMQSDYERKLSERRRKLDARRGMLLNDDDATSTCKSYQHPNDDETIASSVSQQIRLENQLRKRQEEQERRMKRLQAFMDTQPRKHLDDDATTVTEATTVASSVTEIRKEPQLRKKGDTRRTKMYIPRLSPGAPTATMEPNLDQVQGGSWHMQSFATRVSDSVKNGVAEWRLKNSNKMQSLFIKAKDIATPVAIASGKLVLVVVYVVVLAFSESLYIRLGLLVIGLDMRSESPFCAKLAGKAIKYYFVEAPTTIKEAPPRLPREPVGGLLQKTRQKMVQETVHQEPPRKMEVALETANSQPVPPRDENNALARIWQPSYTGCEVVVEFTSERYTPRFMKPSTLLKDVLTSWGWRKFTTIPVIVCEEDIREYVGTNRPTLAILSEQMVEALVAKSMQQVAAGVPKESKIPRETIATEGKSGKQTIKVTIMIFGWFALMIFAADNCMGSIVAVTILCLYTSSAFPGAFSFLKKLSCTVPSTVRKLCSKMSQIEYEQLPMSPQTWALYRNKEYDFTGNLSLLEKAVLHSSGMWFRHAGALLRDSLDLFVSIPLVVCNQKIEVSCPISFVDAPSSQVSPSDRNVHQRASHHRYDDYGVGDLLAQVCHTSRSISEHDRLELARMSKRILDLKRSPAHELGSDDISSLDEKLIAQKSLNTPMPSPNSSSESADDLASLEEQEGLDELLNSPSSEQEYPSEDDETVQTLDSDDEESVNTTSLEQEDEGAEDSQLLNVKQDTPCVLKSDQDISLGIEDTAQRFEVEEDELMSISLPQQEILDDVIGTIQTEAAREEPLKLLEDENVISMEGQHADSLIIPFPPCDVSNETRAIVHSKEIGPGALLPRLQNFSMGRTKSCPLPQVNLSIQCPSNVSSQMYDCTYNEERSLSTVLTVKNINQFLTFFKQNSKNYSMLSYDHQAIDVLPPSRQTITFDSGNRKLIPFELPTSFRVTVTSRHQSKEAFSMEIKNHQLYFRLLIQNEENLAFGKTQYSAQVAAMRAMSGSRALKMLPAITTATSMSVITEVPPENIASTNYTVAAPFATTRTSFPRELRLIKGCGETLVPNVYIGQTQSQALQLSWNPTPFLRDPLERQILEFVSRRAVFRTKVRATTKAGSQLPVATKEKKGSTHELVQDIIKEPNTISQSIQAGQLLPLKSSFQPMTLQMRAQQSKLGLFIMAHGKRNFFESNVTSSLVRALAIERPLRVQSGEMARNIVPSTVNSVALGNSRMRLVANAWSSGTVGMFTMFNDTSSRPMLALGSARVLGLTTNSLANSNFDIESPRPAAETSDLEVSSPAAIQYEIESDSNRVDIDNSTLMFICFYILMSSCDDAIAVTFILIPLGYHLGTDFHVYCNVDDEDIEKWQIQLFTAILTSLVPSQRKAIVQKVPEIHFIARRVRQSYRRSLLRHVASSINLDKNYVLELPEEPVTCHKNEQHTFSFGGFTTTFSNLGVIHVGGYSGSDNLGYSLTDFEGVESFSLLQPCSDDIQYFETTISESPDEVDGMDEADEMTTCDVCESIAQEEEVDDVRFEEDTDCRQGFEEECRYEMEECCEREGSSERDAVDACDDISLDNHERSLEQCPSDEGMEEEEEEVYVHVKAKPSKKTMYNQLSVGAVFAAGVGASLVLGMKRR